MSPDLLRAVEIVRQELEAHKAELAAARAALGPAWTQSMTLAEGIEAKTRALEDCITGPLPMPQVDCACLACVELRRRQREDRERRKGVQS